MSPTMRELLLRKYTEKDGISKALQDSVGELQKMADRVRSHAHKGTPSKLYVDIHQAANTLEDCDLLFQVILRDFNLVPKT